MGNFLRRNSQKNEIKIIQNLNEKIEHSNEILNLKECTISTELNELAKNEIEITKIQLCFSDLLIVNGNSLNSLLSLREIKFYRNKINSIQSFTHFANSD